MNGWYQWQDDELILKVLVQPNSAKDQLVGLHDDAIKIKLTAPALENKANIHLCKFIAQLCGVSKNKVRIESGQHQRHKRVRIALGNTCLPEALTKF